MFVSSCRIRLRFLLLIACLHSASSLQKKERAVFQLGIPNQLPHHSTEVGEPRNSTARPTPPGTRGIPLPSTRQPMHRVRSPELINRCPPQREKAGRASSPLSRSVHNRDSQWQTAWRPCTHVTLCTTVMPQCVARHAVHCTMLWGMPHCACHAVHHATLCMPGSVPHRTTPHCAPHHAVCQAMLCTPGSARHAVQMPCTIATQCLMPGCAPCCAPHHTV